MTDEVLTVRTAGPEGTRAVAAAVALHLRPGDVVVLGGELGAGKTCFVQGAAAALGVTGRVTSPTFTLVRTYPEASPPVVHCDVYRLDRLHDVMELGDDVFAEHVVTFVEWGDAIGPLLPGDRMDVEVALADPSVPEADRVITLRAWGRWRALTGQMSEELAALGGPENASGGGGEPARDGAPHGGGTGTRDGDG